MKRKIAFLVSLLFLVSGALLADGIEVCADLDDSAEEEASSVQDLGISLRSNCSGGFRSRQVRSKLSVKLLRGFHARLDNFLSAGRIKKPAGFSQQELYRLQEVYRL
ncbi:hypothetical protein EPO44_11400 [bacterium]|nr:MAG: hypothetical protein EPO44_11400 [bacterium]